MNLRADPPHADSLVTGKDIRRLIDWWEGNVHTGVPNHARADVADERRVDEREHNEDPEREVGYEPVRDADEDCAGYCPHEYGKPERKVAAPRWRCKRSRATLVAMPHEHLGRLVDTEDHHRHTDAEVNARPQIEVVENRRLHHAETRSPTFENTRLDEDRWKRETRDNRANELARDDRERHNESPEEAAHVGIQTEQRTGHYGTDFAGEIDKGNRHDFQRFTEDARGNRWHSEVDCSPDETDHRADAEPTPPPTLRFGFGERGHALRGDRCEWEREPLHVARHTEEEVV